MSSSVAIVAQKVGKCYHLYRQESDRLKNLLLGRWIKDKTRLYSEFHALRDVSFTIEKGEVVGIVGRNGAGKSTLLQIICGTVQPSAGCLNVNGKIAALLELGAGFNPEFSGLENIYMNAAILGLAKGDVDKRLDAIVGFADIGEFIRRPVKTYSSGMFMRLAFSIATSIDPDILVIDEALSVGDGAFARKSFDRIMELKDANKTILFCSHSMYQIEALCKRVIWLESGVVKLIGDAAEVTRLYQSSLDGPAQAATFSHQTFPLHGAENSKIEQQPQRGEGRIVKVQARASGQLGRTLNVTSGKTDVLLEVFFSVDTKLPEPTIAFGFADANRLTVASILSLQDKVRISRNNSGEGCARLMIPKIPLLKGQFTITVFLACEKSLHVYDQAEHCITLNVTQNGLEQGLIRLPHSWQI